MSHVCEKSVGDVVSLLELQVVVSCMFCVMGAEPCPGEEQFTLFAIERSLFFFFFFHV